VIQRSGYLIKTKKTKKKLVKKLFKKMKKKSLKIVWDNLGINQLELEGNRTIILIKRRRWCDLNESNKFYFEIKY